jgi:L-ascorbate metabolism protein UlaG (beta-lactamase superfamily)
LVTITDYKWRTKRWQAHESFARPVRTTIILPVDNPFRRVRKPKAEIKKSPKAKGGNGHAVEGARKVGLKPKAGWQKRNFVTEVLIPSIFEPRSGGQTAPNFPELKDGEICITWIGHASFLIQTRGRNLLIDPNWAKWLKVFKRMKHPGLHIRDLPNIDLVLVTHAHFDHLDRKTLRGVAADQPIVVPFEVGNLVHDLGFHTVHELHYWETYEQGPLKITLTPCHHWGARILHDTHRGFGGFIIETGGRTVFHCGDTAYFDGFREIGQRYAIDVALMPIGAYDPPSGREVHMNPEEALRAFIDLGARRMVPMHFGTFRLSYEPLDEPPERLLAFAREQGLEERISVMTEGRPMVF